MRHSSAASVRKTTTDFKANARRVKGRGRSSTCCNTSRCYSRMLHRVCDVCASMRVRVRVRVCRVCHPSVPLCLFFCVPLCVSLPVSYVSCVCARACARWASRVCCHSMPCGMVQNGYGAKRRSLHLCHVLGFRIYIGRTFISFTLPCSRQRFLPSR